MPNAGWPESFDPSGFTEANVHGKHRIPFDDVGGVTRRYAAWIESAVATSPPNRQGPPAAWRNGVSRNGASAQNHHRPKGRLAANRAKSTPLESVETSKRKEAGRLTGL